MHNPYEPELQTALARVWGWPAEDADARAVVLRGSGGAFCAGDGGAAL